MILKVSDLTVKFGHHIVLDRISFEIERDDTLAVIGPNGAGKTILIKAILGLIPYSGTVTWEQNVKIGYVPQRLAIPSDIPLTVSEFLALRGAKREKIDEVLSQVKFKEKAHHTRLGELSGGEAQRVLIAYALLGDPQVLILDEPTAGVDVEGEETIYSLIHRLQGLSDLTIIFISHELEVVNKYAANVLCLNKEKICFGPPRRVIDKKTLEEMYGEGVSLHKHNEH